jgi:hypothetical protein
MYFKCTRWAIHLADTTFDAQVVDDVSAMFCKGYGLGWADAKAFETFITFIVIKFNELHEPNLPCMRFINVSAVSGRIEKISLPSTCTDTASEHLPRQKADLSSIWS